MVSSHIRRISVVTARGLNHIAQNADAFCMSEKRSLKALSKKQKNALLSWLAHCTANDRSTLMSPLLITTYLRAKKSWKNLTICRRFAERFTDREVEREKAHNAQDKNWRSKNALGLLLFGNYGTGKSHLCYSILKELDKQGIPGFYITIPDLFDRISDKENRVNLPSILAKLAMVSCLVLDEIGVQSGSNEEKKRLYQIIDGNSTIKNGRPTILITNLMKDELDDLLTQRVTDRINQSTYRLMFTGRSRRESHKNKSSEELF